MARKRGSAPQDDKGRRSFLKRLGASVAASVAAPAAAVAQGSKRTKKKRPAKAPAGQPKPAAAKAPAKPVARKPEAPPVGVARGEWPSPELGARRHGTRPLDLAALRAHARQHVRPLPAGVRD